MRRSIPAFLAVVALASSSHAADNDVGDLLRPAHRSARGGSGSAISVETVGDPDSFGRSVKHLGMASIPFVNLVPDCTGWSPADGPCVPLRPAPFATSFDEANLALIELPAKSAKSLICFSLTPGIQFEFLNDTGVPQSSARFGARAILTVESPVLADPTLLDPTTGLPFGGRLLLTSLSYKEERSLAVGEHASKQMWFTRACIGGLSRRVLTETYGLSEELARDFFDNPMTWRFGAAGNAKLVSYGSYFYGVRLYGD